MARRRTVKGWALEEGRYLAPQSTSRNAVSGGPLVDQLRTALGLPPGDFDAEVRRAVLRAQTEANLPLTGVITDEDWNVLVNGAKPRKTSGATPAG